MTGRHFFDSRNNNYVKKCGVIKLILTMARDLIIIIPVAKLNIAAMAE